MIEATPLMLRTDPDDIMRLHAPTDVAALRARLIDLLWRGLGLPTGQPAQVQVGADLAAYMALPNCARHDKLWCGFDGQSALINQVDVLWPTDRKDGRGLVVYHGGHVGPTEATSAQTLGYVGALLDAGHAVIRVSMPLLGSNYRGAGGTFDLNYPGLGWLTETNHNMLKYWGCQPGLHHPLAMFVEPTVRALSYALPAYPDWSVVGMTGYSGGGWTTVLAAAVDARIRRSYPVAGSLPLHLRVGGEWGDWEQFDPELMRLASYLDLYLLGAAGAGRRQVQINNLDDPSVFSGHRHETYVAKVQARLAALGDGEYRFWSDDHDQHNISPAALAYILADLGAP